MCRCCEFYLWKTHGDGAGYLATLAFRAGLSAQYGPRIASMNEHTASNTEPAHLRSRMIAENERTLAAISQRSSGRHGSLFGVAAVRCELIHLVCASLCASLSGLPERERHSGTLDDSPGDIRSVAPEAAGNIPAFFRERRHLWCHQPIGFARFLCPLPRRGMEAPARLLAPQFDGARRVISPTS